MSFEETAEERKEAISHFISEIIPMIGEDANREGLIKTPDRVAKALLYLTKGYHQNPEEILKSALFKENYRQMVIVKDIDLFSLCEHHMLPFYGVCHVGYLP
ncbi:MAG TPA: GTP cyclohydrolase I, partial [Dysgonamonadaceae bacterium]|nr:GTP cyclohydrolase I [Dysgonamonadaceae bacterium]